MIVLRETVEACNEDSLCATLCRKREGIRRRKQARKRGLCWRKRKPCVTNGNTNVARLFGGDIKFV